jgi:cytochrome P450
MVDILHQLFKLIYGAKMKPFEGIPGPTPHFPFGNALDFKNSLPWEVCAKYGETYGGVTQVWLLSKPALVLNDPKLIEEVLISRQESFYKDKLRQAARPMMTDDSLFIFPDQDQDWSFIRQNHPLSMAYVQQWLAEQIPILQHQFTEDIKRLVNRSKQGSFPFFPAMKRFIFDGFARATVGQVLGDQAFADYLVMAEIADERLKSRGSYPEKPTEPQYQAASKRWFTLFANIVKEAKNNPTGADLLRLMIRQGGSELSEQAIGHVFAEIYFSANFSTPGALTNTLYLLDQNPEWRSRLEDEVKSLPWDSLKLEDLGQCLLLEQCLLESLRIFPPVAFFGRNTDKENPVSFAGHEIPPDTPLLISNWYLHRHPTHWSDPLVYNPTRWDEATLAANPLDSDYFFPFGRGARICIGRHFGLFIIKLALATFVSQVQTKFDQQPPYKASFQLGTRSPEILNGACFPIESSI